MSDAGRAGGRAEVRPRLTAPAPPVPAAYTGVHERTFLAVKPDGVQRRLVGEIVRRFERKGFKLVALKLVQVRPGSPDVGGGGGGRAGRPERGPRRRTRPSPAHQARPPASPGLRGAAAGALRRAAGAPFLWAPGEVHGLGTSGGHGKCPRAGRRAGGLPAVGGLTPDPPRRCGRV